MYLKLLYAGWFQISPLKSVLKTTNYSKPIVDFYADVGWDEAFGYRPGQQIEFKAQPGTFDSVACCEPMTVPPSGWRTIRTPLPSPTGSSFDGSD
ncbi:hypothetical protein [Microcoleus sp. F4-D5]|uniref:hypothetical protein n=1 Tax=Microcoleus sp. F4-D5 TaxID=2818760 RepID=UPI002FD12212